MARERGEEPARLGVFTTDTHLTVRTWDAFLTRITGIAAADALGRPIGTLLPGLEERGLLTLFRDVCANGRFEVLSPALHRGLVECPPADTSNTSARMIQRVTIGPVREEGRITGVAVTVEDVTTRTEREKALAQLSLRLGDPDWNARQSAVRDLVYRGPAIVDDIVRTLREQHHNFSVLSSILDLLANAEIDIVGPLIACLQEHDVDLRIQAALILGERRDRRAVPALITTLDDADVNVRFHAIEALGILRASDAVEKLVAIAAGGDFFLAFPAVHALSQIGDLSVAPQLVPLLKNDWLRAVVAEALGELGDEVVVAPLVQLLNEPDCAAEVVADGLAGVWQRYEDRYGAGDHIANVVRRHITATGTQKLIDAVHRVGSDRLRGVASVMGWLNGPAVQRALTRLLGQESVRGQVVEALVRYGAGVVDLLIGELDAEDLETRQAAVVALGRIGDRKATLPLVGALGDPELALPAAGALARLGDPEAYDALMGLLGHPDSAVRQAVIAALNSIGHPKMAEHIAGLLEDPNPVIRESAVRIAGYFGYAGCADRVIACARDSSEPVRRAAVEHLPLFEHAGALPALTHALLSDTPAVRAAAAAAFARVSPADAAEPLLKALDDSEPWVRYYALRATGRLRHAAIAPAVRRLLDHDPAPQVRLAAIDVLGRLDTADAVAVLQPLVMSAEGDMARAAIRALGHTSDARAAGALSDVLRSADPSRRLEAVMAIGMRAGHEAAAALQWAAAADADLTVANTAISALGQLAAREGADALAATAALIALTAEPARREASIVALAALPKRRIADIARGLGHPAPEVRRATIETLSRMRNLEASRLIEGALDDASPAVRSAAVAELRRLGSRNAAKKLMALARTDPDAEVRHAAVMAVSQRPADDLSANSPDAR